MKDKLNFANVLFCWGWDYSRLEMYADCDYADCDYADCDSADCDYADCDYAHYADGPLCYLATSKLQTEVKKCRKAD